MCNDDIKGAQGASLDELLLQADNTRTADFQRFSELLITIENRKAELSAEQADLFAYLTIFRQVIRGGYDQAIEQYEALLSRSPYPNIKYRAAYSIVNVYTIRRDFYSGTRYIDVMAQLRAEVTEPQLLTGGTLLKALFFQEAGQYQVAIVTVSQLLEGELVPRTECSARHTVLESSYSLNKQYFDLSFATDTEAFCRSIGEYLIGSFVTITKAMMLVNHGGLAQARESLNAIEATVIETQYPRLIAQFYAAKAQLNYASNDYATARINGRRALGYSEQAKFNKPAVAAHLVLSQSEKALGNFAAALESYEHYIAAEKAYTSERQANRFEFQRAKFESE